MKYWDQATQHCPCISKMGLDFCSAPGEFNWFFICVLAKIFIIASSVDAERAFSVGRLEVNHLQHNTSPQTFKAQIAVGSWARTLLYPGLSETIKIVEKRMQGEKQIRTEEKEVEADEEQLGDSDEEARFFLWYKIDKDCFGICFQYAFDIYLCTCIILALVMWY